MYRKEDLKFMNMPKNKDIYQIENELSIEEKIKFIDDMEEGVASYLVALFEKWESEKDSLPKDMYGHVKTISKKAWIKRNDLRKILTYDYVYYSYRYGSYYLFDRKYKCMSIVCPHTDYGKAMLYTDEHVVNQWFHDLCVRLDREERFYFKSINPYYVKLRKLRSYNKSIFPYSDSSKEGYEHFSQKNLNDIFWNDKEDVPEKELDMYIKFYEDIIDFIKHKSKELYSNIDKLDKNC